MSPRARVVTPIDPPLVALVQRVATLEHAVRGLVEQLTAGPRADAQLLDAIATSTGGRVFSADELRRHAAVDPALAQALGPLTTIEIGRRLRRLLGRPVGTHAIVRVARDERGVVWAVGPR